MDKNILSSYIEARDNFRKRSVFLDTGKPLNKQAQFSQMVDAHQQALFEGMPAFNLTEMEALSELVNSRLAWMRMNHG